LASVTFVVAEFHRLDYIAFRCGEQNA
jgi:hypothetical protein